MTYQEKLLKIVIILGGTIIFVTSITDNWQEERIQQRVRDKVINQGLRSASLEYLTF